MAEEYGLYQTLLSKEKRDLSAIRKRKLAESFSELQDDQKKAVLLLICIHAKKYDEYNPEYENIILPYDISIIKNDVVIDINKLPKPLRWVLYNFQQHLCEN